jgi:hypothetical protein
MSKLSKNNIALIANNKIRTQYQSKNVFEMVTKIKEIKQIKDWAKKTSLNICIFFYK